MNCNKTLSLHQKALITFFFSLYYHYLHFKFTILLSLLPLFAQQLGVEKKNKQLFIFIQPYLKYMYFIYVFLKVLCFFIFIHFNWVLLTIFVARNWCRRVLHNVYCYVCFCCVCFIDWNFIENHHKFKKKKQTKKTSTLMKIIIKLNIVSSFKKKMSIIFRTNFQNKNVIKYVFN